MSEMNEREFWMLVRQALLMMLDALERRLRIEPRTAELRRQSKSAGSITQFVTPIVLEG